MKVGRHVVRTWSATQPTVATSSGEAELIALAEGASRGLGLRTMMMELGFCPELQVVHVATDSPGKDKAFGREAVVAPGMCAEAVF